MRQANGTYTKNNEPTITLIHAHLICMKFDNAPSFDKRHSSEAHQEAAKILSLSINKGGRINMLSYGYEHQHSVKPELLRTYKAGIKARMMAFNMFKMNIEL